MKSEKMPIESQNTPQTQADNRIIYDGKLKLQWI